MWDFLGCSNDTDPDSDRITAELDEGPERAASFTFNSDGSFSYTPEADFNGSDSFSYKAKDSHNGLSAAATVTISVTPVNDEPVANEDSASVEEDVAQVIDVLANDRGLGDGSINVTIDTQGAKGSASVNADDTVTYTPDSDASGSDSFVYEVCDGDGDCATATVTVTISAVDDQPAAVNDAATTDEDTPSGQIDVLANDRGLGDGSIEVTIDTQGTKGSADVNPNNTITYTPDPDANGTDTFVYEVCDGDGDCATATVTVTIDPINDAPTLDLNGASEGTGSTAEFLEGSGPVALASGRRRHRRGRRGAGVGDGHSNQPSQRRGRVPRRRRGHDRHHEELRLLQWGAYANRRRLQGRL